MKHYRLLVPVILALLVSSCASQKRAWYLQDANPFTPEQIAESGQIRIKPLDRLTIVVNSKDPELAVPFNSSTSLSSVTGVASYSSATNQSLQIRTVDENGMLDMPVIGKIDCKGKTRSELAQAIADKIYERHTLITDLLITLGVNPEVAAEDACRIEHVISEESFAAIKDHLKQTSV